MWQNGLNMFSKGVSIRRFGNLIFSVLLLGGLFTLAACGSGTAASASAAPEASAMQTQTEAPSEGESPSPAAVPSGPAAESLEPVLTDNRFYPWVAYWDYESAIPECGEVAKVSGSVSVFAAYFNGDDALIFPDSSVSALQAVRKEFGDEKKLYLTYVNDIKYDDGGSSLKDIDLLRRLFASENRLNAHVDEIVAMAKQYGFHGIEIDYENIKKDETLCRLFADFLNVMNDRALKEGLGLRVVLETSALGMAQFPVGLDYTVMCYNLYGNHSGEPGPKADRNYIIETASKCLCLGSHVSFAFATGGFDWTDGGSVNALTEQAAAELAADMGASPERDQNSGALSFSYQKDGAHTVWYADGETLCAWMDTAKQAGINRFALWRLGGNRAESLQMVSSYINGAQK